MSDQSQQLSVEAMIDAMVTDPDRFETAKYVEMGVPMFLIGEDTTSAASVNVTATDPLGAQFAELARAFAARKPVLDLDDLAALLEALAERYFLTHGTDVVERQFGHASAELALPAAVPPVMSELATGMAQGRAVRLVNFHATPRYREAEFRQQIEAYSKTFEPITASNFADAVAGRWPHDRPGLMPTLFEGYRDNLDVLLPILEEFGFTGWFFIPSAFLSVPAHDQRSFAGSHCLHLPEHDEYPDRRIALNWDEAREIARRGHAFACHTRTHNELTPQTMRSVLVDEIVAAKTEMEAELGDEVSMFCWLGGAEIGVNAEADAMLREAGYRYLFSNFKIQKLQ